MVLLLDKTGKLKMNVKMKGLENKIKIKNVYKKNRRQERMSIRKKLKKLKKMGGHVSRTCPINHAQAVPGFPVLSWES